MSEEKRKHVFVDPVTGDLDLQELPDPTQKRELLDALSFEFAFEPLDHSTLEKMDSYVRARIEVG